MCNAVETAIETFVEVANEGELADSAFAVCYTHLDLFASLTEAATAADACTERLHSALTAAHSRLSDGFTTLMLEMGQENELLPAVVEMLG